MQLAWYVVEEDMTLTEISSDEASEIIDTECLAWYVCSWPGAYVDSDGVPVVVQGIMGLEGSMV